MDHAPSLFDRFITGQISWSSALVGIGVLFLVAGIGLLYFGIDLAAVGMPSWTGEACIGVGAVMFVLGWILAFAGK